jgi:DNA-directed RNA polymerase specialized sigma24 family protein
VPAYDAWSDDAVPAERRLRLTFGFSSTDAKPLATVDTARMDLEGVAELQRRLARLGRTDDPAAIAELATELLETLRVVQQQVSTARDDAVVDLSAQGMSLHEIARAVGLTRGRVFQIVQRGRGQSTSAG